MRNVLLITALLFAIFSCRTPDSRGNIIKTSGDLAAVIAYDNSDTLSMRNLSVFARINRNMTNTDVLPLELNVTTPSGKFRTDTVLLTGKDIIGNRNRTSGTSDVSRMIYEDAVLQEKGEYSFSVRIIGNELTEYLAGIIIE